MKNKFCGMLVMILFVSNISFSQNPLFIPPLITGPVFNLNVQADSTEFYTGHKTPTYGVNGNILAPTLEFNRGQTVTLNVTNQLNTVTTMHWHGLHVPAMADGGPHQIINPGTTWSPSFTVLNDAATYWYHPHGQGKTDLQVSKGLAGLIIVRDSIENAITLPRTYGVDDFPLIIQSKCFDILYQVAIATALDTVPMINATINPMLDAPAQVVRFRVLNASSDRSYMLGFSNNMSFYQIATDGGLRQSPLSITSLLLSPGERSEILVDLSSMQGQSVSLMNLGTLIPNGVIGAQNVGAGMVQILDYNLNPLNGADYTLMQINVIAPTANPVTTIPGSLVTLNPWDPATANYNRAMTFAPMNTTAQAMVDGPFGINNHMYDPHMIEDTVYLNNVEVWTLVNQTLVAHPFHIHDVQFFVTDVNGGPVPDHMQGKKDVVLVGSQGSVSFVTKFEDFTDTMPYMYHCHLLHHEDDGMMGSFIVIDSSTTGTIELQKENFTLYPNPANNLLGIKLEDGDNKYFNAEIIDFSGRKLFLKKLSSENSQIDISYLEKGTYVLHLTGGKTERYEKFVKQ